MLDTTHGPAYGPAHGPTAKKQVGARSGEFPEAGTDVLPEPENKRHYPALDGLRGVAVLMVFVEHYLTTKPSMHWGWAGVDLFFVLSGFLITGILYDTRNAARRFSTFYMRRTLRIFPLYYSVLLFLALLDPILHWKWNAAWLLNPLYLSNYNRLLFYPTFIATQGGTEQMLTQLPFRHPFPLALGHFWSLALEEQFYLVWPLIVFSVCRRARLRTLCLVLCAGVFLLRVLAVFLLPAKYLQVGLLYYMTPFRVDALLLGALAALMLRGPERAALLRAARISLRVLCTGFAAFQLYFLLRFRHAYPVVVYGGAVSTVGYLFVDLLSVCLILVCLSPGGLLFRVFTLRPLRWLGGISYGFYVLHDIPHLLYVWVVQTLAPNTAYYHAAVASLAFCSTTLLAWLSFRFYETPFLRLKAKFTVG